MHHFLTREEFFEREKLMKAIRASTTPDVLAHELGLNVLTVKRWFSLNKSPGFSTYQRLQAWYKQKTFQVGGEK